MLIGFESFWQEIPRCTSGSGGEVAAGVVVVLRVVTTLVMRVRIHA